MSQKDSPRKVHYYKKLLSLKKKTILETQTVKSLMLSNDIGNDNGQQIYGKMLILIIIITMFSMVSYLNKYPLNV